MSDARLKSVELRLVETANDLVEALRAAQFARFIQPDDTVSEAEATAVDAFEAAFGSGAEAWEDATPAQRASLLAGLGRRLEDLAATGLHVHAAATTLTVPGDGEPLEMPVALLTIGRESEEARMVMVPAEVEVEGGTTTH